MTDPLSPDLPLLSARGLSFLRHDEPVFGPLDLDLRIGEALLVQGANGSGKTTLLRVLAGLLRARERFAGRRVGLVLTGGNVDLDRLPWQA